MNEGAAVNVEGLWAGCPSRTQDEELPFVSSRESVPAHKPPLLWGFCMPWQQGFAGHEKNFKLGGIGGGILDKSSVANPEPPQGLASTSPAKGL